MASNARSYNHALESRRNRFLSQANNGGGKAGRLETVVCWSRLILTQVDISSQICLQGCHVGSLTWAMVGVFTSDKSEYATNKGFLFSCEELTVKLFTSILMIGNIEIEVRMGAGRSLTLSPPPTLPQGIMSLYSYRAKEILLQFKELSSGIQTGVGAVFFFKQYFCTVAA